MGELEASQAEEKVQRRKPEKAQAATATATAARSAEGRPAERAADGATGPESGAVGTGTKDQAGERAGKGQGSSWEGPRAGCFVKCLGSGWLLTLQVDNFVSVFRCPV